MRCQTLESRSNIRFIYGSISWKHIFCNCIRHDYFLACARNFRANSISSALWLSSSFWRLPSAVALPSAETWVLSGSVFSDGSSVGSFWSWAVWLRVDDRMWFGSVSAGAARFRVVVSTSTEASLELSMVLSVSDSSYTHKVRIYLGFTIRKFGVSVCGG